MNNKRYNYNSTKYSRAPVTPNNENDITVINY
jgi:hypothetical protein